MFHVGDRVVYPMHGAGVIEAIEERDILGETTEVYVMRMPVGDMQVLVPVESSEAIGLRRVMDEEQWVEVQEILSLDDASETQNWNRRYRENAERLKSGDMHLVAAVVRDLLRREREKGLSTGERRMLDNALQILVSEVALALDLEPEEAEARIEAAIPMGKSA
ncbi:MAG: CarD family transcriptional regulator [Bacillota bacterium]|nr:CarD family transcriptional regulator [Bacillota bacterium]